MEVHMNVHLRIFVPGKHTEMWCELEDAVGIIQEVRELHYSAPVMHVSQSYQDGIWYTATIKFTKLGDDGELRQADYQVGFASDFDTKLGLAKLVSVL